MTIRFLPSVDTALVVEFGSTVDRALSDRVLRLAAGLARTKGVVETVPTFRSIMIHYDPLATGFSELKSTVEALLGQDKAIEREAKLWHVPACYEGELAPDLEDVARRTDLSPAEVVKRHAAVRYHIYMLGFLPGYPYMGDLPAELRLPRRTDPRVKVPAGSAAIATTLTAIYTLESPGGWHLIGTTPLRFFDPAAERPALLAPGDAIEFEPVAPGEFAAIKRAVTAGDYKLRSERLVL